jgi:hypothetical protein
MVELSEFKIPKIPEFPPVTVPVTDTETLEAMLVMPVEFPAVTLPVISIEPVFVTELVARHMALVPLAELHTKFPVIFRSPPAP